MDKRLLVPLASLILLYGIGIYAYHILEKWSYLDGLYFLTMTFTTIGGYGNMIPQTEPGKILTIGIAWGGVAVAIYTFSIISDMMSLHDDRNRMILDKLTNPFNRKNGDKGDNL